MLSIDQNNKFYSATQTSTLFPTLMMTIPKNISGLIIGKQGSRINEIQVCQFIINALILN